MVFTSKHHDGFAMFRSDVSAFNVVDATPFHRDFPDDAHKNHSICFEEKIKPQVREILTGYGDLCLIRFDTPCTISPAQTEELYRLVKALRPGCQ